MANRANGEGTIYEEKARSRWVGQLYVDGRRRKVTARTRAEVVDKMNALKARSANGGPAGDGNATVADILKRWEERELSGRDLAPSTFVRYRWSLDLISAEFGSKRLRSLDVDSVENGLDRIGSGLHSRRNDAEHPAALKRSSVARVRSVFVEVLDSAVRRRLIPHNPARDARLSGDAGQSERRTVLTPAEAAKLYDACAGEWLGNLFRLMLSTGLRPGEACALFWDDIDLDAGTLTVRRGIRMTGSRPALTEQLKTACSYRTIGLPSTAIDSLRAQRAQTAEAQLRASDWDNPTLVFPSRRGTLLSPSNVRRELTEICRHAQVPRVAPNELRHTAASALSDAGAPIERVADLLGHRSTRMLDLTYRHRVRPSVDTAVGIMDEILEPDRAATP